MSAALVPFAFGATKLQQACWLGQKPWFTRRAIGVWLGYRFPQQAINKIVQRSPHLADPRWSAEVKTTSPDGKRYDHQLHDPIGLQLILMKSNQAKALEYQVAAANLVWAYMTGQLKPYREPPPELAPALACRKGSRARGQAIREIMAAQGWKIGRVRYRINRLEAGLPPAGRRGPGPGVRFFHKRYRAIAPKALELRRQGLRLREIAGQLGVPLSTVGLWVWLAADASEPVAA